MFLARTFNLALLAAAVVAVTAGAQPSTEPGGSDDSSWLQPNAEVIVKIDVKQMMASDLMKKGGIDAIKKAIEKDEKASKAFEAMGLDVTKDIDTLLISASGGGARSPKDVKGRIVVRGRFDQDKITDLLKKRADAGPGVKLVKEGSTQLFEFMVREDQVLYGAFIDRNTMVLTQTKEATADLVSNGGRRGELSKLMRSAQRRHTGKESVAISLVVNDEMKKALGAMKGGELAAKLDTLTAGVTLTDAVAINLTGATGDPKAAAQMKKMLEALKATGAALLGMDENIPAVAGDILNAINVGNTPSTVNINLVISRDMIDKLPKPK